MGLDNTVNIGRIADAFEKIAAELFERNRIERERLVLEFPVKKEPRPAEVIRPDEERRELLSDKPTKEWVEETEAALPQSRFAKRLDEARQPKSEQPARGGTPKVPKAQ